MKCRKAVVVFVAVIMLLLGVLKPMPARASSTTDIAIIIGSVVGGGIIIALVTTAIVRRNPAWMHVAPVEPGTDPAVPAAPAVKFGLDCRPGAGGPALVCW